MGAPVKKSKEPGQTAGGDLAAELLAKVEASNARRRALGLPEGGQRPRPAAAAPPPREVEKRPQTYRQRMLILNKSNEPRLSDRAYRVLAALEGQWRNVKTGEAWPRLGLIAKSCGLDDDEAGKRWVKRAVGDLLELGLVEREPRYRADGRRTSNRYRFVAELPRDLAVLLDGCSDFVAQDKFVPSPQNTNRPPRERAGAGARGSSLRFEQHAIARVREAERHLASPTDALQMSLDLGPLARAGAKKKRLRRARLPRIPDGQLALYVEAA